MYGDTVEMGQLLAFRVCVSWALLHEERIIKSQEKVSMRMAVGLTNPLWPL